MQGLNLLNIYYMLGTLQIFSHLTFTATKDGYFFFFFISSANETSGGYVMCPDHEMSKQLNWDLVPRTGIRFLSLKIPSLFQVGLPSNRC